ncbi:hypothetical protein [Rothia halotolerans]|uniref:hypothetical protein n=1 Tax=Rothia halotolerans TaxID=405770 RepID=UPI00101B9998|nr:hypothetical protein [Rothia halotolerans]
MSKGQIRRKHAERADGGGPPSRTATAGRSPGAARPASSRAASSRPGPSRAASSRPGASPAAGRPGAEGADAAARPAKGSSAGLLTGVVVAIGVLFLLYVLAWTLPQLGAAAGTLLPELRPTGFGRQEIASSASALGDGGLEQYRYVHRTSGLFAPVLLALGWLGMIALSLPKGALRWLMWLVPVLFAAVYLAGGHAVDAALADPGAGPVALASALVVARWVLMLALLAQGAWLFVRLVRSKVDAFSRGELV